MAKGVGRLTDREKLIDLLWVYCEIGDNAVEDMADLLIANGVTFAKDTDVPSKWISVEDDKPDEFVSVLGHMTDAGDFPAVRECYLVGGVFFFPALKDIHPVDRWRPMPEGD